MTPVDAHSHALPRRAALLRSPVSATASGKAIIIGEHAVVYGARAVAMPVPSLQMSVRLTPTLRTGRHGEPVQRVLLGGRAVTEHLNGVLDDAFGLLGIEPFSLDLEGNSTVLIGAGLGSSASLCVVVLKALAASADLPLSRGELAALGNQLERRFHGNPSGLDTAVVAMESTIAFRRGQTPSELNVVAPQGERGWRFALLDSGVRSSTLSMIQVAAPYFKGPSGEARVADFDALAGQVERGLTTGTPELVAKAMNEAAAHLAAAGVVSEALDELMVAARDAGCMAAKPTGAGGGGCVLTLLDPTHADAQLAALKERLGARIVAVELT